MVEPVFVANFDIGKLERRGVAIFDALGSPPGVRAAGYVFDLIESILNERFEIGTGFHVLSAQRIAGVDRKHGVHLEVFAPFEEFEQAHSVGGVIHPGAGVCGAVDERADGLLPIKAVGDAIALEIVAAGEAQEGRVHGRELLHQVNAVAVDAVVIGGREERDQAEPHRAWMRYREHKMIGR